MIPDVHEQRTDAECHGRDGPHGNAANGKTLRQEREVEELTVSRARVGQRVLRLEEESAHFRRRIEQNLAAISSKLKGLTGGRLQ
jgi:hypothetical protein